eukprot:RCo042780
MDSCAQMHEFSVRNPAAFYGRSASAALRYLPLHRHSLEHPDQFWGLEAEALHWYRRWDRVLEASSSPLCKWFCGGLTNLCYNCVDRHALSESSKNKNAVIWESPELGATKILTYHELYREVNHFAAVMKRRDVAKGDRILVYMPNIPEALIVILACARIGAVHSVVYAGFSVESLANRVVDCSPCMVVCAEAAARKGKKVPLKKIVDDAMALTEEKGVNVRHVVVFDRGLDKWNRLGRDLVWAEEMAAVEGTVVEPEPVESAHPSYILYTSGTTGRPKGIVRDTGGYMVALHASMRMVYGCGPEDIFWATSDVGWVVGHSYIIYGPLLLGIPTVVFEGTPDSPTPAVWWETVQKHRVTVLFSAPTAFRVLRKFPERWLRRADLSSLRHIFLAGEPLDEPTCQWIAVTLGKPVVDHYWQAESGWAMITNHRGLECLPSKPGSSCVPAMGWDCAVT